MASRIGRTFSLSDMEKPEENFSEFKMRISKIPVCEAALRAYWIYPFNVSLMEFAGNSRITLLK